MLKHLTYRENYRLEFRFEAFNALDYPICLPDRFQRPLHPKVDAKRAYRRVC